MTEQELRRVADLVKRDADDRADKAAYGGSMTDGGASALRSEVDAFLAGLDRRLPASWSHHAEQAEREADPEYAEWQRLRRKFGA